MSELWLHRMCWMALAPRIISYRGSVEHFPFDLFYRVRFDGECIFFFFSSRRRHTRSDRDWSSDVCSSDLPGSQVVRLAAGVGLWDKVNGRYLLPQTAADATHPGGAGTAVSPAAFFNVAFR